VKVIVSLPIQNPITCLGDVLRRFRHRDDPTGIAPDEPIETDARRCAQADLVHAPRADEVGEVARRGPVVEEVTATHGQPDLDGVPRPKGVVPAMSVQTADLAAIVTEHGNWTPLGPGGIVTEPRSTCIRRAKLVVGPEYVLGLPFPLNQARLDATGLDPWAPLVAAARSHSRGSGRRRHVRVR